MESVKCKYFCFFIGLAAKDHMLHTCVNLFKSLWHTGFYGDWNNVVNDDFTSSVACIWLFLILWGTLPFLLGLRKERHQLRLHVIIGATQSVAGTVEEGKEDKSMLQGQLQYKIYYWQEN